MVHQSLRILFVHRHLDVRGGAEKILEILVRELTRIGDEIRIASMRRPDTHQYLMQFIDANPGRFFRFKDTVLPSIQLSRHVGVVKSTTAFKLLLRRINTDVTVALPGSIEGTALSMLYLPRPRLLYLIGRVSPVYGKPYELATSLLIRKNAHEIVLGSRSVAEDFKRLFTYERPWLYPAYEETYFTPEPSVKKENVVVMTGRMSRMKRFHYGVIAAKKLLDRGIDFRLKIVGELKYHHAYYLHLKELIDRLGLEERVEVIPYGDGNTLREAYREALVYWNTSLGYFGITNLEAVGCGAVPVVTPNLSEVVEETGVGSVIANLDELSAATADMILNAKETKRQGLEASKRVAEKFGSKAFSLEFRNLLLRAAEV